MTWNNNNQDFVGWPKATTHQRKRQVRVHAAYMTPLMKRARDTLTLILFWGMVIAGLLFKYKFGITVELQQVLKAGLGLTILHYVILPFLLKARVRIIFSEDSIRIRTFFTGWKAYKRGHQGYAFKIMQHPEAEKEGMLNRPGKNRYYRDSYRIYLNHYQGYFAFPPVFGLERANQLFNRLQGVDIWIRDVMPQVWGHGEHSTPGSNPNLQAPQTPVTGWKRNAIYGAVLVWNLFVLGLYAVLVLVGLSQMVDMVVEEENRSGIYLFLLLLALVLLILGTKSIAARQVAKLCDGNQAEHTPPPVEQVVSGIRWRVVRFFEWVITRTLAAFLILIIGVAAFKFFGISRQDVDGFVSGVPEHLRPWVGLAGGAFVGLVIQLLGKLFERDSE
ncbi:hypothetical protein [Nitrospina watsonii]|uniref:Uncharacterized protein n=1 Tax=Nitrospina watsonii TaxID=1323948 RepID=A0ABM9HBJ2_9BACT|nr:hypothetical protein [Nitrospina watsonii]CAI2717506.1 membrane protein of unknown function [Nitrospina watsonii]